MNTRTADIPPEGITTDEFLGRVAKVRSALDKAGLVGLLAFGDCWRGANIGYFTILFSKSARTAFWTWCRSSRRAMMFRPVRLH